MSALRFNAEARVVICQVVRQSLLFNEQRWEEIEKDSEILV